MRLRDLGELAFLRSVRAELGRAGSGVRLGIGDDAAVLECPSGCSLVLSCDAAVEGRHFRREWQTPEAIGGRAVRCALSDLAAMGAQPAAVLLTLVASADEDEGAMRALIGGAARTAEAFGAPLAGGETAGAKGPLTLDVVVAGFVTTGREWRRSGVRPGDVLLVSGTLGDSAAGLAALQSGLTGADAEAVADRYRLPEPRLSLAAVLADSGAVNAAIDISDGLLQDAGHLAEESGVGVEIAADALPLSPAVRAVAREVRQDPFDWAVGGGEDFELLLAVDPVRAEEVRRLAAQAGGPELTVVGRAFEGEGIRVIGADGSELRPVRSGWDHFA
jgi:thiamine-monophosphate kinase